MLVEVQIIKVQRKDERKVGGSQHILAVRLARLCAAALLCLSFTVFGVDVSGPITSNTTWSVNQTPYRATADVVIQNGATLTIEPGVTIFFEPDTNLIIQSGA